MWDIFQLIGDSRERAVKPAQLWQRTEQTFIFLHHSISTLEEGCSLGNMTHTVAFITVRDPESKQLYCCNNCSDEYASGIEGVLNPKVHPIRSINQRIHHVLHGGIIDGVVYFRKWWSVTILSLGKSIVNLTVWSADKSLSSGVSTVCSQDADLCHFFLTVSFSLCLGHL